MTKLNETPIYKDVLGNHVHECQDMLYTVTTPDGIVVNIPFQSGSPDEGVNGITNEALVAILLHRIVKLDGYVPSVNNKAAIAALEQAQASLAARDAELKK